eukprot:scaffold36484_cov229-Amphora_coffeaeformis.AAC.7
MKAIGSLNSLGGPLMSFCLGLWTTIHGLYGSSEGRCISLGRIAGVGERYKNLSQSTSGRPVFRMQVPIPYPHVLLGVWYGHSSPMQIHRSANNINVNRILYKTTKTLSSSATRRHFFVDLVPYHAYTSRKYQSITQNVHSSPTGNGSGQNSF